MVPTTAQNATPSDGVSSDSELLVPPGSPGGAMPPMPDEVREPGRDGERTSDPERPYRVAAWLAIVGSLALAGVLVAVPAHAYDLDFRGRVIAQTRRLELTELWRVQTENLPELGQAAIIQALFVGSIVLFLIGAAYLIWLATVEIRPETRTEAARTGEPDGGEPD